MNEKIFCDIMNRIRKDHAENDSYIANETAVRITMTNGDKIVFMLTDYKLFDGYIKVWTQNDTYCYLPIANIVSITI